MEERKMGAVGSAVTVEAPKRKMKVLPNGRSRVLSCNYGVLERIIISRGFNLKGLAETLGYDKGYFAKVRSRGKIGETCVRLLKEQYNILPQQYEVEGYVDAPTEIASNAKQKVLKKLKKAEDSNTLKMKVSMELTLDREELSQLIKEAVLEVFNNL